MPFLNSLFHKHKSSKSVDKPLPPPPSSGNNDEGLSGRFAALNLNTNNDARRGHGHVRTASDSSIPGSLRPGGGALLRKHHVSPSKDTPPAFPKPEIVAQPRQLPSLPPRRHADITMPEPHRDYPNMSLTMQFAMSKEAYSPPSYLAPLPLPPRPSSDPSYLVNAEPEYTSPTKMPVPLTPPARIIWSSSVPVSPTTPSKSLLTVSDDTGSPFQCRAVSASTGQRCKRIVKNTKGKSPLPNADIEVYCSQHVKKILGMNSHMRTVGKKGEKIVDFSKYIPDYLSAHTRALLRVEMERKPSVSDEDGYIYGYLHVHEDENITEIKVGRSVNISKRMDQWTKQCGSKDLILLGFWPGNIKDPSLDISMMKGRIKAGKKGILCHRHERLVHIELTDLVCYKQYLQKEFAKGKAVAPDERTVGGMTRRGGGQKHVESGDSSSEEERVSLYEDDDNDDDGWIVSDSDDEEDEEVKPVKKLAKSKAQTKTNGKSKSQVRTPKKKLVAPSPSPSPSKALQRDECPDCGSVHKEIFTFERTPDAPFCGLEWEKIVLPIIEKWGRFLEETSS